MPHGDSLETARVRAYYSALKRRVLWATVICVISGLMSRFLHWWNRDAILLGFSGTVFFVAAPVLVVYFVKMIRAERVLNHLVRRELAAHKRSPEVALTPNVPPLYISKKVRSSETSRLIGERLSRRPGLLAMGLVCWMLGLLTTIVGGESLSVAFVASLAILMALILRSFDMVRGLAAELASNERRNPETFRRSLTTVMTPAASAPVLYLRSFTDDEAAGRRYGKLTEEEQLARALSWFGPLLAVGHPGERLPHVGAQRIYLADDVWQPRVTELMKTASLVVIRTGSSQGFRWEVSQALLTVDPERLLLVIDDRDEFRSVVDRIAEYVGRPISRVRLWRPPIASVRGLIMFAAGWSPQALPLRLALFRARDEDGALVSRFVLSLSPLLERHGVSYKTPPWGGYLFWVLTIVFVILAPAVIGEYFFD